MKAIDRQFTKIINGTIQYLVPVFQRDYTWGETQCQQLWDDILNIADQSLGNGHFIGSIVYIPTGDTSAGLTKWLLIDGQQRMTTLLLLFAALRDAIRETGWVGGEDDPSHEQIDAYFLKNIYEKGDKQYKLILRRKDQDILKALIDAQEIKSEKSNRVYENYEFFKENILTEDPAKVYRGLGKLLIVEVTLARGVDDPQLIFESLNSTGVDLLQSDLIRNFVLMRLPEEEQTKLYNDYWQPIEEMFIGSPSVFEGFLRDYIALLTKPTKQEKADNIYNAFRRMFSAEVELLGSVELLLGEMRQFAKYHAAFSVGYRKSGDIHEALQSLRRLVDLPAILIMQLYDCYDRIGSLSKDEFLKSIQLIENYILRRAICGLQTRGYWIIFAKMAYKLDQQSPYTSLRVELARLSHKNRYPSDTEFKNELQDKDIYGLRVCWHLLDRLENFNNKEAIDTSHYSIEHVLPQNENLSKEWQKMLGEDWLSVQETWLHKLGNLTLTGYNSTYSDRPFEDKKTIPGGFLESSVRLNKYIRDQVVWTAVQIQERGEMLSQKALNIWPSLIVEKELIKDAERRDMLELAKLRDVKKIAMSGRAQELFELLQKEILEIDPDIIELAEYKSISYHSKQGFFLEVLPRKYKLTLIVPIDYNEVKEHKEFIHDAKEWKFLFYAKYAGGVIIDINDESSIEQIMPDIINAFTLNGSEQ